MKISYKCSHCGDDSIIEDLMRYRCCECGWWGSSPAKMIYEPETEYRPSGQVCRKPRAA